MINENISFTITNSNNEEVVCDIISIIPSPNNDNESYILFTDYSLDEEDNYYMQYAKIIKNEDYYITDIETTEELEYVKDVFSQDLINFVSKIVGDEDGK
ncbi:MAG: DUF1292 domain-containing protein [Mollicutes bacterium]|nr:DUF1292 domain-containing protein [Mollicutes bacterium]